MIIIHIVAQILKLIVIILKTFKLIELLEKVVMISKLWVESGINRSGNK